MREGAAHLKSWGSNTELLQHWEAPTTRSGGNSQVIWDLQCSCSCPSPNGGLNGPLPRRQRHQHQHQQQWQLLSTQKQQEGHACR